MTAGNSRSWIRYAAAAVGLALVAVAALSTGASIERFFRGEATGVLSWGPTLFRLLLAFHGLLLIGVAWRNPGLGRRAPRPAEHAVWLPPRALAALAALTVAGAILRLIRLNAQLWLDELLTLLDFVRHPLGVIVTSFPNQNQHLLYSILAWASVAIFGESAWAIRLPAVGFGIASIWATYFLARKLIGLRGALLTCALLTFSYHHIWFSQNARGYTGLLFFAVLATWLWLEALDRRTWGWWLAYAVAVTLGAATHLGMLFVPAAHVLVYLFDLAFTRRRGATLVWQPLAAWALAGTLFLQIFALSLPEFIRDAAGEVSPPSEWTSPLWLVRELLSGLRVGLAGYVVVAVGLVLPAIAWIGVFRRNRRGAVGMTLPGLLCAAVVLGSGHNLWPRLFFFSASFALIFLVYGALTIPQQVLGWVPALARHPRLLDGAGVAAVGLLILASAATIPRCYALPKQDYTGARDYVEARRSPGEVMAAVGLAGDAYRRYYAPDWETPESAGDLERLRDSHAGMWLVYTLPFELQGFHPEIWSIVERQFTVVDVFPGTLGGGEVYVCRERGSLGSMEHGDDRRD